MNLQSEISKIIEKHFNSMDLDVIFEAIREDEDFSFYDFIEALEPEDLAEKIEENLDQRVATFDQGTYSYRSCENCGKPFGDFKMKNGGEVDPHRVLSQGQEIIILD